MESVHSGPTTPGARPRDSRTFSFRSDKSGESRESPREKQRRDLIWKQGSKANPNAALSEAQPGVNAVLEESTLSPLRNVQHKDALGNVITDPDLSNPTRPRMERPLDTIRSFEKAIDNGYKRRTSYMRTESSEPAQQYGSGQRSSSYGQYPPPTKRQTLANRLRLGYEGGSNRYSNAYHGGYYGSQRQDNYGPGPSARPRYPASRMNSEPLMYGSGQQQPYPHGHQFSQDTVNTGGSDSTGPWANSTDPSSENSSIERGPSAQKPYGDNAYPPNAYNNQNGYGQNGYVQNGYSGSIPEEGGSYPMSGGAPPVRAPNTANRRPIPLGNAGYSAAPPGSLPPTNRPAPEKRKSWLKRTFSRKD